MQMQFLLFPRGRTARGTPEGGVIGSPSFFNEKGKSLLKALAGESERAQVLIATAFLDKALKCCMKAQFKKAETNSEQRNTLIGAHGSILGTFGAKISACRGFGLIEKEPANVLDAIKHIRNSFAHSDFAITLADPEVNDQITILEKWLSTVAGCSTYTDSTGNTIPAWIVDLERAGEIKAGDTVTAKHIFLGSVVMLYLGLANIQWAIDPSSYDGPVLLVGE